MTIGEVYSVLRPPDLSGGRSAETAGDGLSTQLFESESLAEICGTKGI